MARAYAPRYKSLGTLDGNESTALFQARDLMAMDSGILSVVGDVQAAGGGTVTVEYYVDEAGTLGGSSAEVMNATVGYILHLAVSPDIWIKLTMSGRTTDDIDFYAC